MKYGPWHSSSIRGLPFTRSLLRQCSGTTHDGHINITAVIVFHLCKCTPHIFINYQSERVKVKVFHSDDDSKATDILPCCSSWPGPAKSKYISIYMGRCNGSVWLRLRTKRGVYSVSQPASQLEARAKVGEQWLSVTGGPGRFWSASTHRSASTSSFND